METIFSPIDIHDIDEHGSYFTNISSNPCSHEKSPELISLSNIAKHEIFNPLFLPVHKDFKQMIVDAYVYHKYCRSRCVNLEIGTRRLVLEGKPLHQLERNSKVSQGRAYVLKQEISRDNMSFHLFALIEI
jgi:hypothetical protein